MGNKNSQAKYNYKSLDDPKSINYFNMVDKGTKPFYSKKFNHIFGVVDRQPTVLYKSPDKAVPTPMYIYNMILVTNPTYIRFMDNPIYRG